MAAKCNDLTLIYVYSAFTYKLQKNMLSKSLNYFIPFACIAMVMFGCNKDAKICTEPMQVIADDVHKVDLNLLEEISYFRDTLDKYPFLKVSEIKRNAGITIVFCDIYINRMQVFNHSYSFYQVHSPKFTNQSEDLSKIVLNPNLSKPKITAAHAINRAKQTLDFSNRCINYQIGYTYHNQTYKLCYQVYSNTSNCFYVTIDAENGDVLKYFDCIYYKK